MFPRRNMLDADLFLLLFGKFINGLIIEKKIYNKKKLFSNNLFISL